jgi:hypothetical protein
MLVQLTTKLKFILALSSSLARKNLPGIKIGAGIYAAIEASRNFVISFYLRSSAFISGKVCLCLVLGSFCTR